MTTIEEALNKQNAITDGEISKVFTRLIKNNKISEKAVTHKNGNIQQNIGAPNSLSEYFKRFANIGVKNIPTLTTEQILQNKEFQDYRAQLNAQGYDVEIKETKKSTGTKGFSIASTVFKAAAIGALTLGGPFIMPLGTMAMSFATALSEVKTFETAAHIKLNIKKLEPVALPASMALPAPEAQEVEQVEASNLLAEINQQTTKQTVREPAIT
tara:strand:+ start:97733 stop:98371 length:639 start_codon:yes stop_codon:yes gene_type:complete